MIHYAIQYDGMNFYIQEDGPDATDCEWTYWRLSTPEDQDAY